MTHDDLKKVVVFLDGLRQLSADTGITISNDYLWEEGKIVCGIDHNYEIRTT